MLKLNLNLSLAFSQDRGFEIHVSGRKAEIKSANRKNTPYKAYLMKGGNK